MPKYDYDYYITMRKSRVRCVYFTDWPPHTYCLVRNGMYFNTFDDADSYCNSIFLRLLSMTSAPMYRICRLIRLFRIKDRRLWVKNTVHQPSTLGWEDCYFRAENKPKPPVNCDSCNISVICVDDSIYSDVSQCVTRTEGDNDVEYCYEDEKVDATEVNEQCKKHSSVLVDTQRIDRGVWTDIRGLFYLDLEESWVDLNQNDLRYRS
ncbi:uncharacterized protein LOC119167267 [Rhipicephalus microplus]|uniref:uncharacterized protein LOC119167267 n=1 Tax=Rhipicephalus microplus TaxID=6941 RepID=UPI003F6D5564